MEDLKDHRLHGEYEETCQVDVGMGELEAGLLIILRHLLYVAAGGRLAMIAKWAGIG